MPLKIYLVSRPTFDLDAFLFFIEDQGTSWRRSTSTTEPEEIVEVAGRTCYMSFGKDQSPKTNAEYIQHLIRMGHESVLEHVNWSFLITGVSRGFTHQLVRHRVGFAFSQLSQQYHNEQDADFVEPPKLDLYPSAQAAWQEALDTAKDSYRRILESLKELEEEDNLKLEKREVRRAIYSIARSVLPNATETKIFVTANARALRHFLKVRGSIPGDEEMRQVAAGLLRYLKVESPSLFSDFEIDFLRDDSPIVIQTEI